MSWPIYANLRYPAKNTFESLVPPENPHTSTKSDELGPRQDLSHETWGLASTDSMKNCQLFGFTWIHSSKTRDFTWFDHDQSAGSKHWTPSLPRENTTWSFMIQNNLDNNGWLVVEEKTLWKYESQLGWWHSQYMEKEKQCPIDRTRKGWNMDR